MAVVTLKSFFFLVNLVSENLRRETSQGYNDLPVGGVPLSGPLELSHLFGFSVSGTLSCLQILLHGYTNAQQLS